MQRRLFRLKHQLFAAQDANEVLDLEHDIWIRTLPHTGTPIAHLIRWTPLNEPPCEQLLVHFLDGCGELVNGRVFTRFVSYLVTPILYGDQARFI